MVNIYYDSDAKLEPLLKKTVAVIGYGSQGRAHALNLRDLGVKVIIGLKKEGRSWGIAKKDDFKPIKVEEANSKAGRHNDE